MKVAGGRFDPADARRMPASFVEGPRVMTNVVADDADAITVGQRVATTFDDTGDGSAFVRFKPVEDE